MSYEDQNAEQNHPSALEVVLQNSFADIHIDLQIEVADGILDDLDLNIDESNLLQQFFFVTCAGDMRDFNDAKRNAGYRAARLAKLAYVMIDPSIEAESPMSPLKVDGLQLDQQADGVHRHQVGIEHIIDFVRTVNSTMDYYIEQNPSTVDLVERLRADLDPTEQHTGFAMVIALSSLAAIELSHVASLGEEQKSNRIDAEVTEAMNAFDLELAQFLSSQSES